MTYSRRFVLQRPLATASQPLVGAHWVLLDANRFCSMPKLLAIDATANSCSVAASDGERSTSEVRTEARAHARLLLPMIQRSLTAMGWDRADIDAVVYGAGPGSFTGLRIGFGIAQGMAYGLSRPMVPVGSLECAAFKAMRDYPAVQQVSVVLDARMGELYGATFTRDDSQLRQIRDARLISGTDATFFSSLTAAPHSPESSLLVALNLERASLEPLLPANLITLFTSSPTAADALAFAFQRWNTIERLAPATAALRYVRNAVATPPAS